MESLKIIVYFLMGFIVGGCTTVVLIYYFMKKINSIWITEEDAYTIYMRGKDNLSFDRVWKQLLKDRSML